MTVKPFDTLTKYKEFGQKEIKASEVVQEYIAEYVPAVQAEQLTPIQAKMKEGQRLILEGLQEFYQLQQDYRQVVQTVTAANAAAARETGTSHLILSPFHSHRELSGFDERQFEDQLNKARELKLKQ